MTVEEQLLSAQKEIHDLRNLLQNVSNQLSLAKSLLEESANPFDSACVAIRKALEEINK